MMGGPSAETAVELKEVREKQAIARSGFLRGHSGYLTAAAFRERRAYFAAKVHPTLRIDHCVERELRDRLAFATVS